MARYFFNLRYGRGPDKVAIDPEGDELASVDAAREHALRAARDLIDHTRMHTVRDWFACSFEVEDEGCRLLFTVPFSETVPDAEGSHGRVA